MLKVCHICHLPFPPHCAVHKYCSNPCRAKAKQLYFTKAGIAEARKMPHWQLLEELEHLCAEYWKAKAYGEI